MGREARSFERAGWGEAHPQQTPTPTPRKGVVGPPHEGEVWKVLTLAHRIGSIVVGLGRLGLIGAVGIAGTFPAIATLPPIVAAAARTDIAAAAFARIEIAIILGAFRVPARLLPETAIRPFALMLAVLRSHLRLGRHDDAVIVLGVLEIAFRRDNVARGQCVARQRHIFLGDMRCGPADLHVGPVRFVVPR